MMKHRAIQFAGILAVIVFGWVTYVSAHCEVPCGIYNDQLRVELIKEHASTIEKSMKSIESLNAEAEKNYNQIVRWVSNKEAHANEIQHIVTQYFMTQRIKVPAHDDEKAVEKYNTQLALLHGMLVHAMKSKQTTDASHCKKLLGLVEKFEGVYFGKADKKHLEEHK